MDSARTRAGIDRAVSPSYYQLGAASICTVGQETGEFHRLHIVVREQEEAIGENVAIVSRSKLRDVRHVL